MIEQLHIKSFHSFDSKCLVMFFNLVECIALYLKLVFDMPFYRNLLFVFIGLFLNGTAYSFL